MESEVGRKIGAKIREERKQAGLTQETLAEKADLSLSQVGYIERGEVKPSIDSLIRLARALDVDPSTLLEKLDRPLTKTEVKKQIRRLLDFL